MGYQITQIQNSSNYPGNPKPIIIVSNKDSNWSTALKNYLAGGFPTDSPEWKKGIFAIASPIDNAAQ